MVRQRKSHTRVKKGPAAQAEVLSGDGQPDEGETGEGSSGAWEKVGTHRTSGTLPGRPGAGELTQGVRRAEGPAGTGGESRQKAFPGRVGSSVPSRPERLTPPVLSPVLPADLPAEGPVDQSLAEGDEKKKQQRRGRKKSKLEDMFPVYLQVGLRLRGARAVSACRAGRSWFLPDSSHRKPSLGRSCWT